MNIVRELLREHSGAMRDRVVAYGGVIQPDLRNSRMSFSGAPTG